VETANQKRNPVKKSTCVQGPVGCQLSEVQQNVAGSITAAAVPLLVPLPVPVAVPVLLLPFSTPQGVR
jgi:hypothetical protein